MCGIYGVYNFGTGELASRELLSEMDRLIFHRGPDDSGMYVDGCLGIGMRRLSIIDLSTGHQPIANEDGTVRIVFNGEIYNFQELRDDLLARGHVFTTKCDTETIVHLYEEYGRDCVKKLRGMFAFAIWDARDKSLFLARDRMGKKPLNYCLKDGRFIFCSELRGLLSADWVSRDIDCTSVDMYLSLQYIPSPRTIYRGVNKLEPGHTLVLKDGNISIARYWDLPLSPAPKMDRGEAKAELVRLLKESTKIRLISDVPLGAFLSGGIDSSIVVALMSELSSAPVKTFSVGFDEQEFCELSYARAVAERYGCEHHEFIVRPEMSDVLPKLAWHYSEPYADPSALPTYYVAWETRKFVTVALNGDGGDENFAGYKRYAAMRLAQYLSALPLSARKGLAAAARVLPEFKPAPYDRFWQAKRFLRSAAGADVPHRHVNMISFVDAQTKAGLYSSAFKNAVSFPSSAVVDYMAGYYGKSEGADFINRLLYLDMHTYLPEGLMTKVDIAAMANSLEGRSPLLDHKFMEFAFSLPGDWKLSGLSGSKRLLKEAFRDRLPEAIASRGKMGFGIPLGPWFRGRLKTYWQDHCLNPKALSRGYFDPAALRALWQEHQSGRQDHGYKLWAVLMLELWHETYADGARL